MVNLYTKNKSVLSWGVAGNRAIDTLVTKKALCNLASSFRFKKYAMRQIVGPLGALMR